MVMQSLNRSRLKVSARDARLVGHDQHHESGSIQAGDGFGCTRDEFKILNPVQIVFLHIDRTVPVEENRSTWRLFCER